MAPTIGQLEVLAIDTFQTGPFTDFGKVSMHGLVPMPGVMPANFAGSSIVPFSVLHTPTALAPD